MLSCGVRRLGVGLLGCERFTGALTAGIGARIWRPDALATLLGDRVAIGDYIGWRPRFFWSARDARDPRREPSLDSPHAAS